MLFTVIPFKTVLVLHPKAKCLNLVLIQITLCVLYVSHSSKYQGAETH